MSLSFPSLPFHFLSFSGASWRLADKQWRMVKNCHLLHHVERDVKGGRTPPRRARRKFRLGCGGFSSYNLNLHLKLSCLLLVLCRE